MRADVKRRTPEAEHQEPTFVKGPAKAVLTYGASGLGPLIFGADMATYKPALMPIRAAVLQVLREFPFAFEKASSRVWARSNQTAGLCRGGQISHSNEVGALGGLRVILRDRLGAARGDV